MNLTEEYIVEIFLKPLDHISKQEVMTFHIAPGSKRLNTEPNSITILNQYGVVTHKFERSRIDDIRIKPIPNATKSKNLPHQRVEPGAEN